jgi:hypothetical protein
MKKSICFFVAIVIFSCSQITAQQNTALKYWKMENDTAYTRLMKKQIAGVTLSGSEQSYMTEYKSKLNDYFTNMPDSEKSIYYKNRISWSAQPWEAGKITPSQDQSVYAGEKSMYSQYLWSSGLFGFLYGSAAVYVFGMDSEEALVAVPLVSAGVSVLIPMLSMKDKYVSYNSLSLSLHGKGMGLVQGAALGLLIVGNNVEDGKLLFGLATLSSIGMGRLGYNLGKTKSWSEGRVGLYSYYGAMMPFEGMAIIAACNIEDPRIYAASSLAFGAGGYLIADRIANWNDFTRGDLSATQTLAVINGLLGVCIISDMANNGDIAASSILIPAAGFLGGTIAGHLLTKNARLTYQQGRNTAFASAAGAVIGIGLTAIATPETATPYYVVSYLTGLSTYAIILNKYKKTNQLTSLGSEKPHKWDVNFMPQNILINKQLANRISINPMKRQGFLPAFSASVRF